MKLGLLVLPIASLLASLPVAQETIHVPGDQLTIQAGIAVASDGDTVLVAPGMYQERVDFLGKAVSLKSAQGPLVTTITAAGLISGFPTGDPESVYRVVRFINGEDNASVLDGFAITSLDGGYFGGGIYCVNASPVIRNCIIRDIPGNGIWGNGLLEDCQILRNGTVSSGPGAGVRGSPTMLRCEIAENIGGGGAGVFGAPSMIECVIRNNFSVESHGGGLYATAPCVIESCV